MALKSVFNFAPLNKDVYYPKWADAASQDIPFEDGEDGTIQFEMTNVSPLFIRDGKKDDPMPFHIEEKNGDWRFLIPATSIKGMLRSTMEVFAFAKLTQFQDRYFGWRDFEKENYKTKVEDAECGWMYKEGDKYMLTLCIDKFEKIKMQDLPSTLTPRGRTSYQRNESLGWYPLYEGKRIVCTGQMNGKLHEYLFANYEETYEPEELPKDVVTKFLTIYENTPDFDKYLTRLNKGGKVAVFVLLDSYNEVELMGLPRQLRLPYKKGVKDLVLDWQSQKDLPDLCETIFGYLSSKSGNKRGRVQVGFAKTATIRKETALSKTVSGVLATPKASYYPLYLQQDPSAHKYLTYDNAHSIAGRKFYRVREKSVTERLAFNARNNDVNTSFRPLVPGQTFTCKINVHNLKPVETGALLSALLLHKTKGAYHNLGLAKGYGYGKMEIHNVRLQGLKKTVEEYLAAFEKEMNQFLGNGKKWNEKIEVLYLLQILSEHKPSPDLGVMDMNQREFRNAKRNSSFDTLQESNQVVCPSFLKQ